MKADKDDVQRTGDDMDLVIIRHEDAMKHNPDLAAETRKLRDKWFQRYNNISDKPKEEE